jgi:hypothetical protein
MISFLALFISKYSSPIFVSYSSVLSDCETFHLEFANQIAAAVLVAITPILREYFSRPADTSAIETPVELRGLYPIGFSTSDPADTSAIETPVELRGLYPIGFSTSNPADTSAIETPVELRGLYPIGFSTSEPEINQEQLGLFKSRQQQAKRYASLFARVVPNAKHSRTMFLVRDADDIVLYHCDLRPEPVKNAYILLRLYCSDNIESFRKFLADNNGIIPDYGLATR